MCRTCLTLGVCQWPLVCHQNYTHSQSLCKPHTYSTSPPKKGDMSPTCSQRLVKYSTEWTREDRWPCLLCHTMACFCIISYIHISIGYYPCVYYVYVPWLIMTSQWVMILLETPIVLCHTMASFCVISYIQISIGYYPCSELRFVDITPVHTTFMIHDSLWHHNG